MQAFPTPNPDSRFPPTGCWRRLHCGISSADWSGGDRPWRRQATLCARPPAPSLRFSEVNLAALGHRWPISTAALCVVGGASPMLMSLKSGVRRADPRIIFLSHFLPRRARGLRVFAWGAEARHRAHPPALPAYNVEDTARMATGSGAVLATTCDEIRCTERPPNLLRRRWAWGWLWSELVLGAGCGNYSNTDLDFQWPCPPRRSGGQPPAAWSSPTARYYRYRDGALRNNRSTPSRHHRTCSPTRPPSANRGAHLGPFPADRDPASRSAPHPARAHRRETPKFGSLHRVSRRGYAAAPGRQSVTVDSSRPAAPAGHRHLTVDLPTRAPRLLCGWARWPACDRSPAVYYPTP